jgi:hypothetical protein
MRRYYKKPWPPPASRRRTNTTATNSNSKPLVQPDWDVSGLLGLVIV